MQKKLCRVMTLLVTITLLIFLCAALSLGYSGYSDATKTDIKSAARIIESENNTPEQAAKILKKALDFDVRVTFIQADGKVTFDSVADVTKLENHGNREEFKKAMADGSAEATRFSDTLDKNTYYFALKYQGGVLRISTDRANLTSVFLAIIPITIVFAGAILVITTIISIKLSEDMIKPINKVVRQLDLQSEDIGSLETPYEELEPIIRNADVMMKRIRKNMEKIRNEKEKISLITANMVEGMVLIDEDMTILTVNNSALRILNEHFDVHEHEKVNRLTDNEQLLSYIDEAGECGAANGIITVKGRNYRAFINRVSTESNSHFGTIVFLVDVTETVQSEAIRRDFSANVSHELKTPLTTIKGFGEMLDNGIFTEPDDIRKYGGMIYRESERLLCLINDIIGLSEIEENEHVLSDRVNLMKTAHEVEEIIHSKAISHNISIHISGEPLIIDGHQSYITELFLNLMDNAVKYGKEQGDLWVSIEKIGDNAVIKFSDNGIGISEENCSRIFERFYRVDKSRSKKIGGTGLGLSIVKHIVNYHSGEINIHSKLDEGTEITISLPTEAKLHD